MSEDNYSLLLLEFQERVRICFEAVVSEGWCQPNGSSNARNIHYNIALLLKDTALRDLCNSESLCRLSPDSKDMSLFLYLFFIPSIKTTSVLRFAFFSSYMNYVPATKEHLMSCFVCTLLHVHNPSHWTLKQRNKSV